MHEHPSIRHKLPPLDDNEQICWCFNYRIGDIVTDYRAHQGRSTILARLLAEKRTGTCDCARKNPKGR